MMRVILLAGLLVSAGCDLVTSGGMSATATDEWTRTYELAPGGRVEIINANGEIEVEAGEGATVEVRARLTGRGASDEMARDMLERTEIRDAASDTLIRIETIPPRGMTIGGGSDVRYHVRAPVWAATNLRTTNGRIVLTGLSGEAELRTTNGTVTGRELTGPVQARTTNGAISLAIHAVGDEGIRAQTTNGAIALNIPRDARATVSARVTNGRISASDLPLDRVGEPNRRRLDGDLNGGGPRIEARTTNGGITIRGSMNDE